MASLANQTISSTYDGLIKTSTDQPVGVSGVQLLEDGVGNTLALSVGRANQGATVTGTLTATTLAGTLSTAAQTNITSVGTLSSLAVSGNLTVDTDTLYVDAANNRVGIGTSSPINVKLQIEDSSAFAQLAFKNSNGGDEAHLGVANTGDLLIRTGGSERMRIDSSGRVGIGTSSPAANLEVNKGSEGLYLQVGGDNASNNRALEFTSSTSSSGSNGALHTINARSSGGEIALATAGSERLHIDSSGDITQTASNPNFSINANNAGGTASLNINGLGSGGASVAGTRIDGIPEGAGSAASMAFVTRDIGGTRAERMRIDSSGNVGIGTSSPSNQLEVRSSSANSLQLAHTGSSSLALKNISSSLTSIEFVGASGNAGLSFVDASSGGSERMRIDASGRVGINTTSLSSMLNVAGDSTTPALRVFNGGLSAPVTSFSAAAALQLMSYQSVGGPPYTKTSAIIANADSTVPSEMQFWTKSNGSSSPAERMRIDSSGNVGIGTSSPSASLEVLRSDNGDYLKVGGAVAARSLIFTASATINDGDTHTINASGLGGIIALATADTERMRIDSSGNILVGKTLVGISSVGIENRNDGLLTATRDGGAPAIFNRLTSDGILMQMQKDTVAVGSISVTGSSTTYNTSSAGTVALNSSGLTFDAGTNYLDDYEEGTWTPSLLNVSVSYTNQSGTYTKIGNRVFFEAYIEYNTLDTTDVSSLSIGTLPFNAGATRTFTAFLIPYTSTGYTGGADDAVRGWIEASFFTFVGMDGSSNYKYNSGKFAASGQLRFSGSYKV